MTKKENEMQENKAIIDLTLEEALMCLSRTLYDRNVDIRVIMARQDLIGVIERKTQYLQDLLDILKKHCDFALWNEVLSIMPKEEYRYDYEDDVYTSVRMPNEEDRKAIKEWLKNE